MAQSAKQAKLSAGETVSRAINGFSTDIYTALLPDVSSENLIFSPFSLHTVLGMVSQGAKGETKTELIKGLKFKKEDNDKKIQSSYNFVINSFQEEDEEDEEDDDEDGGGSGDADDDYSPWILRTANRVYSQSGFELNDAFVKGLKKNFLADFKQLDFSSKSKCQEAAGLINRWVAAQTKDKILDLLNGDSLTPELTSLVLVNCIYFKGIWSVQFQPDNTHKRDFSVSSTKKVKVNMMHLWATLSYAELPELDATVLDMPYRGQRLSMRIFLPKAVDGLAKIQNGIGTLRLDGKNVVTEAMEAFEQAKYPYKVNLSMPKFKIEMTIENLKDLLINNLGMKSMFSEVDADFGGIPVGQNDPPLFASTVVQKAYISVSEEGTEAAAATQMGALRGACRTQWTYVDFTMDRPFYFEIVDHENDDLVLFSGHCNDPTQK